MKTRVQEIYDHLWVLLAYIVLAYLFHGFGHSITKELFGAGDGFTSGLPTKIFAAFLSPWNPYVQLGKYSFLDTQYQHFYLPGLIIFKLFPTAFGYNLFILLHYVLAGFFTFLFLKRLSLNKLSAYIGGVCFMFGGFLSAHKGHQALMSTAVWLPLALYFMEGFCQKRHIRSLIFASFALATSVLAGFAQLTAYTSMVMVLYSVFRVWGLSEKSLAKKLRLFILVNGTVFAGAVLLSAVQLLPVASSLSLMTREKLTYASFSEDAFPIWYTPILLIPNLFGGLFGTAHYGTSLWPGELHGYMGLLPTLFAVLAFFALRKTSKQVTFWFALLALSFVLSLGNITIAHKILFHLPVLNLFRAPARHLYEINFAISVLAAYFIHYLTSEQTPGIPNRKLYLNRALHVLVVANVSFLTILFILRKVLGSVVKAIPESTSFKINHYMTWRDAINQFLMNTSLHGKTIPLLIITSILAGLLLYKLGAPQLSKWVKLALILFIVADLGTFGRYYYSYPDVSFLDNKDSTEEYRYLTSREPDPQSYRIFPIAWSRLSPHLNLLYGEMTINDYSPMWLKDYKRVAGFELNGDTPKVCQLIRNPRFLSISSTKYLLTSESFVQKCIEASSQAGQLARDVEEFGLSKKPKWILEKATANEKSDLALSSRNGSDISIALSSFAISPLTIYRVTFEARHVGKSNSVLLSDFYSSASYDRAEHDFQVDDLTSEFQEYKIIQDSGGNTPKTTHLRFYTQSPDLIEVRNVRLERMKPTTRKAVFLQRYETEAGLKIYENMNVLPRIRFVSRLKPVDSLNEFLHYLNYDEKFDPKKEAYVQGYKGSMSFHPGVVRNIHYTNNNIEIGVETGEKGWLILADTWFPGWHASVDNIETPIYKVNGLFRGIPTNGAGEHHVKFWFVPPGYYLGLIISCFAFLMAVGILVWESMHRLSIREEHPSAVTSK